MTLYLVHYTQRAFIFPFLIKSGNASPLFVFVSALVYCTLNGYLQSASLLHHTYIGMDARSTLSFYTGVSMFCVGMGINIHSDHILRNLRKPGEVGYKIPRGGMFNYISGANFFGEIVEWCGFALACQTLPSLSFAIFSVTNLAPRACHHHRYYRQKFEDYPKQRKALIPYIL
ncbi:hypothetical protein ScPMuIL_014835 [Solemya velum]